MDPCLEVLGMVVLLLLLTTDGLFLLKLLFTADGILLLKLLLTEALCIPYICNLLPSTPSDEVTSKSPNSARNHEVAESLDNLSQGSSGTPRMPEKAYQELVKATQGLEKALKIYRTEVDWYKQNSPSFRKVVDIEATAISNITANENPVGSATSQELYGFTPTKGRIASAENEDLVDEAHDEGIDSLDTDISETFQEQALDEELGEEVAKSSLNDQGTNELNFSTASTIVASKDGRSSKLEETTIQEKSIEEEIPSSSVFEQQPRYPRCCSQCHDDTGKVKAMKVAAAMFGLDYGLPPMSGTREQMKMILVKGDKDNALLKFFNCLMNHDPNLAGSYLDLYWPDQNMLDQFNEVPAITLEVDRRNGAIASMDVEAAVQEAETLDLKAKGFKPLAVSPATLAMDEEQINENKTSTSIKAANVPLITIGGHEFEIPTGTPKENRTITDSSVEVYVPDVKIAGHESIESGSATPSEITYKTKRSHRGGVKKRGRKHVRNEKHNPSSTSTVAFPVHAEQKDREKTPSSEQAASLSIMLLSGHKFELPTAAPPTVTKRGRGNFYADSSAPLGAQQRILFAVSGQAYDPRATSDQNSKSRYTDSGETSSSQSRKPINRGTGGLQKKRGSGRKDALKDRS